MTECQIQRYNLNRGFFSSRSGMTLIELLIVLAIMGILVGIAIPVVRLASVDSKSRLGAVSAETFVDGAIRDGKSRYGATLYFEKSFNNTAEVKRILKGRKKRSYRGEDASSYALRGPNHTVGGNSFVTFWLYNVNPNRTQALERIRIDGYDGWFIIHQRLVLNRNGTGSGTRTGGTFARPMVLVFCRPEASNMEAGSGGTTPFSPEHRFYDSGGISLETQANIPYQNGLRLQDFIVANENDRPNFWPPNIAEEHLESLGASVFVGNVDFPKFQNGKAVNLLKFEITQPPTVNENEVFEFKEGVSLFANLSGMTGGFSMNHPGEFQFAENVSLATHPQYGYEEMANPDSPFRIQFMPRVDFDANGNIDRVFAQSASGFQYYLDLHVALNQIVSQANGAFVPLDNSVIPRLIPFSPNGPLFFLVGEESENPRNPGLIHQGDQWLVISPTTAGAYVSPAILDQGGISGSRNDAMQN